MQLRGRHVHGLSLFPILSANGADTKKNSRNRPAAWSAEICLRNGRLQWIVPQLASALRKSSAGRANVAGYRKSPTACTASLCQGRTTAMTSAPTNRTIAIKESPRLKLAVWAFVKPMT